MAYQRSSLHRLYDPEIEQRPMRVADLMSGSGTNVVKTMEHQQKLATERGRSPYEVVVIFTDNKGSKAQQIAEEFSLPWECDDIADFYVGRGHPNKRDLSLRPAYFERVVRKLEPYRPDIVVLGGFMSIVTEPLLSTWLGINVHPADLSIVENGRRKYTGDNAVRDQILAGEKELCSSTHLVRPQVDYGEVLLISKSLPVDLEQAAVELASEGVLNMDVDPRTFNLEFLRDPRNKRIAKWIADKHQGRLKEMGDWVILPRTVEMVADGRFALGEKGVYLDGVPIPAGCRLA
ncbi:MAG: formyl transferase [Candidatus Aenigmarchaeota archaeon]|nr:formyl transferase [Candidatus Aenigmarchaeota archaeon]